MRHIMTSFTKLQAKGGLNKTLRNGLMRKLPMKLKIVINYLKSLKNQNSTLTNICIMQQDIK